MTGRKTIIGLCMLCAMAFSAIAAQSASAVGTGTTMFTCVEGGTDGLTKFSDPDCEESNVSGKYGHKSVANGTVTTVTIKPTTVQKFKATQAGVAFTVESSELEATAGTIENAIASEDHRVIGKGIKLTYSNVVMVPPELKCGITGLTAPGGAGMITTNPLGATTAGKEMTVVLTPEGTEVFTEFEFTGSGCPLKGTKIKVVGSRTLERKGSTLMSVHNTVTTEGTFRLGSKFGPAAGYEGTSTISAGHKELGGVHNPIGVTTTGQE